LYNISLHGWFSIGPKIGCPNHLLTALFDKQMQATEIGMSRVRIHNQNMTRAAKAHAERKILGHLS
jgi:hypothetical protein